jgi:hypothetical protein
VTAGDPTPILEMHPGIETAERDGVATLPVTLPVTVAHDVER